MASTDFLEIAKRHFDLSFAMLETMVDQCPDDLWNEKNGSFVFWQQILHALTGINFWMRLSNEQFIEPFAEKRVYPELEKDPETALTKSDLRGYKDIVKGIGADFFDNKNDEWLNTASIVYDKLKNMDIVIQQIRHIQYHVGHCNSILREKNREAVEWLDLYGD